MGTDKLVKKNFYLNNDTISKFEEIKLENYDKYDKKSLSRNLSINRVKSYYQIFIEDAVLSRIVWLTQINETSKKKT